MDNNSPALPDFLVIGGMRCGSTTLTNILNSQQAVFIPPVKEVHYFDQRNTSIDSLADYQRYFINASENQYLGEATPDYLTSSGCASRIHRDLPDIKLIMILRDPVRRAWSHYRFSMASGREIEPFANALNLEAERLAHPIHEHDIFFSYQQRGRYIDHIEGYLKLFKREQLHIILLEDLNHDPDHTVKQLFEFVGITADTDWKPWLRITNQTSLINLDLNKQWASQKNQHLKLNRDSADFLNSGKVKFIPQSVRDALYRRLESKLGHSEWPDRDSRNRLKAHFAPFNQRLSAFLGRALPW